MTTELLNKYPEEVLRRLAGSPAVEAWGHPGKRELVELLSEQWGSTSEEVLVGLLTQLSRNHEQEILYTIRPDRHYKRRGKSSRAAVRKHHREVVGPRKKAIRAYMRDHSDEVERIKQKYGL